jgi:hypothetical protein
LSFHAIAKILRTALAAAPGHFVKNKNPSWSETFNGHEGSDGPSGVDALFFDKSAAVEVAIHKQRRPASGVASAPRELDVSLFLAISA